MQIKTKKVCHFHSKRFMNINQPQRPTTQQWAMLLTAKTSQLC